MSVTKLLDGFSSTIELAELSETVFWEIEVTPPGWSGGGAIDNTTMHNETYRTASPKSLKTLSDMNVEVAYGGGTIDEIKSQINQLQTIKVTFPDGDTWEFEGWLDEFTPGALTEGGMPTATLTLIAANQDSDGAEVAPSYTAAGAGAGSASASA